MSRYSYSEIRRESQDCAKSFVAGMSERDKKLAVRAIQLAHHIVCKFDIRGECSMVDDITRILFETMQSVGGER